MAYGPSGLPLSLGASAFAVAIGTLLMLSGAALSQQAKLELDGVTIVPNTIEFVPPLAKAVLTRDAALVGKLIVNREDINARVRAKEGARAGFTPLILAASLSDIEIAQMLIDKGAKITVLDDFNRSAFWYAALNDNFELTTVLVRAEGARDVINAADSEFKRTPLHLAVHGHASQLVQLLVKLGASRDQKDVLGESATDFCKRRLTEACGGLN
jgi:ankyrin repeat protein